MRLEAKNKLDGSKEKIMEMIKKFVPAEKMLEDYETTYIIGTMFDIFDDLSGLVVDQANQIDDMEECLKDSYEIIKNLEKQITELRKEVTKKAQ